MVDNPVWAICERVAEVQPLLDDHVAKRQAFGRGRGGESAGRAVGIGVVRAMFDVGYFPPNTPLVERTP